ncbi:hypothetical protein K2173_028344 [Erythroxylum novogranatense]|uniref:TCP domain-containing protein n=1 Tax=Erythroxylum novogranatense TaxID=1862640 RepID=A0AAV8U1I7_9ROSI|nr:hypothetical protein K2173_028344 [Erythroxylum novogranatense]
MITNSRGKGFQGKQEGEADDSKYTKAASTSRQWSAFRNPRIVRVSRAFGGKDRHSKVCTIRGLRDRRIRLSVPTAIQLYDLQDKLGLSQPSKVIDWLLDATKTDIDKLPPLQLPQAFGQFHQQMLNPHELRAPHQSSLASFFDINSAYTKDGGFHSLGIKRNNNLDGEDQHPVDRSRYWDFEASLRGKSKEVESAIDQKGKWIKTNDQEYPDGACSYSTTGQAQRFFPISGHSSLPILLNNSMPINPYYLMDASNLSLSQFGSHGFVSQAENSQNNNAVQVSLPPSLSLSSGSQLFLGPPATMSSLFAPFNPYGNASHGSSRDINHFQLLGSSSWQHISSGSSAMSSSSMKPFLLNVNPGLVHLQTSNEVHRDKDNNS